MPAEPRRRSPRLAAALACAAGLLALIGTPLAAQVGLSKPVAAVRVEGTETIPEAVLLQKVSVRVGRPVSDADIRADVKTLYATKWFSRVGREVRDSPAGPVVVYTVKELPILGGVQYLGNDKVSDAQLARVTGLKPGSPYRVTFNRDAAEQIRRFYVEKGYRSATCTLERGDSPDDRAVVFRITEGPKVRVGHVEIRGNRTFSDAILKRDLETKASLPVLPPLGPLDSRLLPRLPLFGLFDPQTVPRDEAALTDYYKGLGFFDVRVIADVRPNDDGSRVFVTFEVDEGPQYRIRNVLLDGNDKIPDAVLLGTARDGSATGSFLELVGLGGGKGPELKPGDPYNARFLRRDIDRMNERYGEKGRLFTKIDPEPVFEDAGDGMIDLVYHVDEDRVRYVRHVNARILGDHPHTKTSLIHNSLLLAPGDLADPKMIRKSKSRVGGQPAFQRNVELTIRPVEPGPVRTAGGIRGQSPDAGAARSANRPAKSFADRFAPAPPRWHDEPPAPFAEPISPPKPVDDRRTFRTAPNVRVDPAWRTTAPEFRDDEETPVVASLVAHPTTVVRGQSPQFAAFTPPPVYRGQAVTADAAYPAEPGVNPYRTVRQTGGGDPGVTSPLFNQSPQGDPFGGPFGPAPPFDEPPGFVDLDIAATEERTGRFMVGAAVNSSSGIVGQFTLQEDNFDLFRPPRSFADLRNGTAFRGGGQRLRIEAVPGAQVSRYSVSLSDPFFLDTIYSAGVSGFYFSRFYDEYDEQRLGGRVNVGRQLTPFWSVVGTSRLESVKIFGPRVGNQGTVPPTIAEVLGDNTLFTLGASLKYDSRDRAILPGEGTFFEAGYTQGVGQFTYPKLDAEIWRYFTLAERPDGTGQQVLSVNGTVGFAGDDLPLFERYFLGGYQTLRGYDFRGVSPLEEGVRVGGTFQAYGSVQYRFPILVNDALQGVVFTDFGTVNDSVSLDDFRATVGAGLRVSLPQVFGPAPLAFDFAVPVAGPDFDDEQLFSFQVGVQR